MVPTVEAMLLCERVAVNNKKITLHNLCSGRLHCPRVPAVIAEIGIYLRLSGGRGQHDLNLKFVDLSDGTEMRSTTLPFRCRDPLKPDSVVTTVCQVPIPHYGVYSFDLWIGDDLVHSERLEVIPPPA